MIRLLLALLLCSAASAQTFTGKVVGIQDGDTITVMNGKQAERIRLANIDAPEKAQAFGQKSKQSMSDLAFGKQACVQGITRDKYGRLVASVEVDGRDLSREQVRRGMAGVYERYNTDTTLPGIEHEARAAKRGQWVQAKVQQPADFRAQQQAQPKPAHKAAHHANKSSKPQRGHCRSKDGQFVQC